MNVRSALRVLPIVPVLGVAVVVTGLWESPGQGRVARSTGPTGQQSVLVAIDVREPADRFRWEAETLGLMAAMLEGGLSSMYAVTAQIGTTPVAAGLEVATAPERWTATLEVDGTPEALQSTMRLCDPRNSCEDLVATGTQERPDLMARALVEQIGLALDRKTDLATAWTRPQSKDGYAQLVAGRSAAVWYGWIEGASEQVKGDVIRDPVARAPWLDPTGPIAQWMAARRYIAEKDALSAEMALRRGAEHSPGSLLDVVHATILMRSGSPDEAAEKFRALGSTFASDPRMEFNEIEALLVSGNPGEATRRLDAMPELAQDAPRALELRTEIEKAEGKVPNPDGLLARWQETDPYDPEPVRLRIDALVQQGRFEEALALTGELGKRGADDEARGLELALAAELGEWSRAADAAERMDEGLAAAIRQLHGASKGGGEESRFGSAVRLQQADQKLERGDADGALALIHQVLQQEPGNIDALLLQIETWSQKGNQNATLRARCALHNTHPGALGDPASAEMISLSRRCAQR